MDKTKQKSKKDKSTKYVDKDKVPSFITDVKTLKENLKIREILRTVKMNSSMRIKAPRGSKVMENKDFNDNDGFFDESASSEHSETFEPPSATNPDVVIKGIEEVEPVQSNEVLDSNSSEDEVKDAVSINLESNTETNQGARPLYKSNSLSESLIDFVQIDTDTIPTTPSDIDIPQTSIDSSHAKIRDRKLSLDHTILSKRENFSQSELDLHSIGKSPLERKSSFFRKKMDSFLKNTTEIFKRQSFQSKSQCPKRRESISVSLQSLNENGPYNRDNNRALYNEELQGSEGSLQWSLTAERSASSLSVSQSDRLPSDIKSEDSLADSQSILGTSQPLIGAPSSSVHSLNETYVQEAHLNRAISMNSGLDSAHGQGRRKTSRSNRVTWVASEGLTNYFRRVIQDEKKKDMQTSHSYQDFSTILENNLYGGKTDSKGRRLSYQRAVSGEDPVISTRYQDSSLRRKQIPENSEPDYELSNKLSEFTRNGIPPLQGFAVTNIKNEAYTCILWVAERDNLMNVVKKIKLQSQNEEARQAALAELVLTEADYIRHLKAIVDVFMATAHALQDQGRLLILDSERLFFNIPDILNANLYFWEVTFYPMITDCIENKVAFNSDLMAMGFQRFREIFQPYEKYVVEQSRAVDYLRELSSNEEFMIYLSWCHSNKSCNRLQLSDLIIKPLQRLTKYNLFLRRLIELTNTEPQRTNLFAMDTFAKTYVSDVNKTIRYFEEMEKLENLANSLEPFEIDFKDEDLDRAFSMYSDINIRDPIPNCGPCSYRNVIHEGEVRFKDNAKEIDAKIFILTDVMLVCKKITKGSSQLNKMVRQKYMINKLRTAPKFRSGENGITFVVVDDTGSSCTAFTLTDFSKDIQAVKIWDTKLREARHTLAYLIRCANNPIRDINDLDFDDISSEYVYDSSGALKSLKITSEETSIRRDARERVAVMLHRNMGTSTEHDISLLSMPTDSLDGEPSVSAGRTGTHNKRHVMHRTSTGGSSRNSRLSSFQQSFSSTSNDEPQPGPSTSKYQPLIPVETFLTPVSPANSGVTSIIVNVVSESETETVVCAQQPVTLSVPPVVVLPVPTQPPKPLHYRPNVRSSSASRYTLKVQSDDEVKAMQSLPNLAVMPLPQISQSPTSSKSASERLYQSHNELLQQKGLTPQHQQLSPDRRGTSHPPHNPPRGTLKRGVAFSHSSKNPPLLKMGHVNSQSTAQFEFWPMFKSEKSSPSTSDSKSDKKQKQFTTRYKDNVALETANSTIEDNNSDETNKEKEQIKERCDELAAEVKNDDDNIKVDDSVKGHDEEIKNCGVILSQPIKDHEKVNVKELEDEIMKVPTKNSGETKQKYPIKERSDDKKSKNIKHKKEAKEGKDGKKHRRRDRSGSRE